jgi:Transposase DDE domain
LQKRINQLDISSNRLDDNDDNDGIIIAIDSTGIKVTNIGQWMQDKWNIKKKKKKKKGYLKIHIAVDIKTKEILALEFTDEKVHDGRKIMPKLIEHILTNNNHIKIMSVIGDRSYDSNGNFKYLQNKRILPAIKVRKNSIITRKNNRLRNREVYSQLKDLLKWKKRRGHMEKDGWLKKQHFPL